MLLLQSLSIFVVNSYKFSDIEIWHIIKLVKLGFEQPDSIAHAPSFGVQETVLRFFYLFLILVYLFDVLFRRVKGPEAVWFVWWIFLGIPICRIILRWSIGHDTRVLNLVTLRHTFLFIFVTVSSCLILLERLWLWLFDLRECPVSRSDNQRPNQATKSPKHVYHTRACEVLIPDILKPAIAPAPWCRYWVNKCSHDKWKNQIGISLAALYQTAWDDRVSCRAEAKLV